MRKRDGGMGGATGRHETFRLQTAIGGVSCLSLIHMLHPLMETWTRPILGSVC